MESHEPTSFTLKVAEQACQRGELPIAHSIQTFIELALVNRAVQMLVQAI